MKAGRRHDHVFLLEFPALYLLVLDKSPFGEPQDAPQAVRQATVLRRIQVRLGVWSSDYVWHVKLACRKDTAIYTAVCHVLPSLSWRKESQQGDNTSTGHWSSP